MFRKMVKMVVSKGTPTYPVGAYPRHPLSPPNDSGIPNHKLLVQGLGYAPGVCWKVVRLSGTSKT